MCLELLVTTVNRWLFFIQRKNKHFLKLYYQNIMLILFDRLNNYFNHYLLSYQNHNPIAPLIILWLVTVVTEMIILPQKDLNYHHPHRCLSIVYYQNFMLKKRMIIKYNYFLHYLLICLIYFVFDCFIINCLPTTIVM
jgi:hypothetical protein